MSRKPRKLCTGAESGFDGGSAHYGGTNSFLEITNKETFADNDGVVVRLVDNGAGIGVFVGIES